MRLYRINKITKVVGQTPKGRERKVECEELEERNLRELINFESIDYDGGELESIKGKIDNLVDAVTDILLADPDKFKDYFEKRVESENMRAGWSERPKMKLISD